MTNNFTRILVLALHTDDGEFGCGGSIAKFVEEGKEVFYITFSTTEESIPEGYPKNILEVEVRETTKILGIDPHNLEVYKFHVRKLDYIRQEILEKLIKLRNDIN